MFLLNTRLNEILSFVTNLFCNKFVLNCYFNSKALSKPRIKALNSNFKVLNVLAFYRQYYSNKKKWE